MGIRNSGFMIHGYTSLENCSFISVFLNRVFLHPRTGYISAYLIVNDNAFFIAAAPHIQMYNVYII